MRIYYLLLLSCFFAFLFKASSQIHCGLVELVPNTTVSQIVTFDSFTKYNGGININSVARVRVRVEDQAIPDPLCSWSLIMTIDNNAGVGTPVNQWEELVQYGGGLGNNPAIGLLEVRVRNACTTSPNDGVYQTFANNGDILNIIEPLLPRTNAGSCANNVNGPGSYLTNYDEFNFDIDIRVRPDFTLNPGVYALSVRFRLEENP